MKRKIIKAKTLGFCGGVNHAISLAKKALDEQNNVYSYGPMVHNPRVLQELESLGLKTHKPGKPLPSQGGTQLIRSDGICPF